MARVGKKWTTEEDELLREEVKNKMNYEEIAENHKRNIGGIKSRVISNIIAPLLRNEENKDKEVNIKQLEEEYGIEEGLLRKYLGIPSLSEENLILNEIKSLKSEIMELKKTIEELKERPVILYVF
jgi:hypothetical protein